MRSSPSARPEQVQVLIDDIGGVIRNGPADRHRLAALDLSTVATTVASVGP